LAGLVGVSLILSLVSSRVFSLKAETKTRRLATPFIMFSLKTTEKKKGVFCKISIQNPPFFFSVARVKPRVFVKSRNENPQACHSFYYVFLKNYRKKKGRFL